MSNEREIESGKSRFSFFLAPEIIALIAIVVSGLIYLILN